MWFNSVTQEYRAKKPVFELAETGLRLTGVPVPPPDRSIAAAPCADCPSSIRLLQLIERARHRVQAAPAGSAATLPVPNEFEVYRRDDTGGSRKAWQLTEALLQRLQEATGNRLVVFYVPSVAAVYDDSWREIRRVYGLDEGWNIHLAESRLAEMCLRLSIPMVSPTWQFREQARRGKVLYFLQDGHWNSGGHRLVAEILSNYIKRRMSSSP